MLLLTDIAGQEADVSPEQRLGTLVLWNPWFLVGGLVFGLSAREFGRADGSSSGRKWGGVDVGGTTAHPAWVVVRSPAPRSP
ncbi:hypothetical protein [Streptomyces sp. NPDC004232]|uniref:hypothetical protein n=1 Tax=unclassified Streptomyces TaxID=2593676 RepID=UPI001D9C441C|nr:hypothetical protein [Streptomyces sp. tea 10]